MDEGRHADDARHDATRAGLVDDAAVHASDHDRRAHVHGRRHGHELGNLPRCGAARRDGFTRFFIVRTQPRGFRTAFRAHPLVAERTIERPSRYNALCDEIERLERAGAACVFYPDEMPVDNKETNWERLCASYETGYAQAQREVGAWEAWLAKGREERERPCR